MLPSPVFLMNRDQLAQWPNAHFPKHMSAAHDIYGCWCHDSLIGLEPAAPFGHSCYFAFQSVLSRPVSHVGRWSREVLSSLGKQLHSNRAVEVLKQMEQRKLRTDVPWTPNFKVWMFKCSLLDKKLSAGIQKWLWKLILLQKLWLKYDWISVMHTLWLAMFCVFVSVDFHQVIHYNSCLAAFGPVKALAPSLRPAPLRCVECMFEGMAGGNGTSAQGDNKSTSSTIIEFLFLGSRSSEVF